MSGRRSEHFVDVGRRKQLKRRRIVGHERERLAKGRPPACVEACKYKAMSFGDLKDAKSPVAALLRDNYSIRRKPELGTQPAVYYVI